MRTPLDADDHAQQLRRRRRQHGSGVSRTPLLPSVAPNLIQPHPACWRLPRANPNDHADDHADEHADDHADGAGFSHTGPTPPLSAVGPPLSSAAARGAVRGDAPPPRPPGPLMASSLPHASLGFDASSRL